MSLATILAPTIHQNLAVDCLNTYSVKAVSSDLAIALRSKQLTVIQDLRMPLSSQPLNVSSSSSRVPSYPITVGFRFVAWKLPPWRRRGDSPR